MAILEQLGLTQDHYDRIDQMKKDPASFGITSQYDYAKKSGKDLVSRSDPGLGVVSALGQTVASPVYDYGQALKEFSKKGYEGEFSFTPQGVVDFAKNVGSVGKEFLDQKPITMAAGRFMGGLEALGERYGILDPYADIRGQTAGLGIFGPISKGFQSIFGPKMGKIMFTNYVKTPAINKSMEAATKARKELQEKIARAAALKAAQEEINRMGYTDYGSGGASAATQASYQDETGNYAGASTQDHDTPD